MRNVSSVSGLRIGHSVPGFRTREKKLLFEGSDGVVRNKRLTGMDTHLRIATIGTIVARTCSLLLIVSRVQPRNRGGRTRTNNTRTDDLLVALPKAGTRENDSPNEGFPDQMYSICPWRVNQRLLLKRKKRLPRLIG